MVVDRTRALIKFIGEDIVKLAKQFYRGSQILKISDPLNAYHFVEVNSPLMYPVGINPQTGEPIMQPVLVPDEDPNTGEIMKDDKGRIIMVPLNDPETDIEFAEVDIVVHATRTDNAEEKNQLLFETFINGPMGQTLLQANPAGAFEAMAMMVSEFGTKHSIEIARMLMSTSAQLKQGQIDPSKLVATGKDVQALMGAAMGGSTGNSQNTARIGRQPGNSMGIPPVGKEGGRPPQIQ
jgi:hypothetical protein